VRNLITDVPGVLVGNAHDARAATGVADPPVLTELGTVAADCLARAVARDVYEATALPYKTAVPDWKTRFGGGRR
jgi:L-aminopeptidase/D-esterase-like protein